MNKIIKIAIEEALSSESNFMVGAVVHNKSKIYSSGFNCAYKTHPEAQVFEKYNRGHHAEMSALIKVRHYDLKNLELTVIRISKKDGSLQMAKPCEQCMELISNFDIRKIHYSDGTGKIITLYRPNHRIVDEEIESFAKSIWIQRFSSNKGNK